MRERNQANNGNAGNWRENAGNDGGNGGIAENQGGNDGNAGNQGKDAGNKGGYDVNAGNQGRKVWGRKSWWQWMELGVGIRGISVRTFAQE